MNELREIMEKFALCGWKLICEPAQQWLDGEIDNGTIIPVIQEADKQCGSCGCEFDPLYKRALELLLCSCKENTLKKISIKASNTFCPQPLYLYGTYKEDGQPNYGLFCWCAYCAVDNLKFVACIGEDKLTRDRIRQTGMFSATIVTEELLSEADWCGTHSGYEFDKSEKIPSEKGAVLNVPVPEKEWHFLLPLYSYLPGSLFAAYRAAVLGEPFFRGGFDLEVFEHSYFSPEVII